MINEEVVGDGGGGGDCGSGGEAHPNYVTLLFDGPSGRLVDLFFSEGGEFDRITTSLPLFAMGFKKGLK